MKKTILITAYAVNPFKGSEDGTGWNIIRHLADHNRIIAVTRHNNRPDIEHYFRLQPSLKTDQLHFAYFDLPRWLCFWKKGGRGALLYHYLWHLGVVFFILKQRFHFDIAHHLNFHSDWTPSFLWVLGKPFVWGPIGHHAKVPRRYILEYGKKAWLKDRLKWWTKRFFWTFDPFLKITKRKADCIIGVNSHVFKMLGANSEKCHLIPAVATGKPECTVVENAKFQVLTIGRFVPLKGFDLAIRSFADCFHRQPAEMRERMQLTLIGRGPEKEKLQGIAGACRLPSTAIRFVDWVEREELPRFFAASSLFFFPSHEGAGMVVPEALSYGLPVLCFDNYGPGENVDESCAVKIPYSTYGQSIRQFSGAIERLLTDPAFREKLSENASIRFSEHFTWQQKALRISGLYEKAGAFRKVYSMA